MSNDIRNWTAHCLTLNVAAIHSPVLVGPQPLGVKPEWMAVPKLLWKRRVGPLAGAVLVTGCMAPTIYHGPHALGVPGV